MNPFTFFLLFVSVFFLASAQFQPRTSPRRNPIIRPMTRNMGIVGRRGPVPPSPRRPQQHFRNAHSPGFKPPTGIAKKLNEAVDFRALARVLLKQ